MTSTWSCARALVAANVRSSWEYRGAFLLQAVLMMFNNLLFLAFWAVFFARFEDVRGWGLSDVALLYAVSATGFGLAAFLAGGCFDAGSAITDGRLDSWLLRPRSAYLLAALSRSRASGAGDVACGLLLLVASGNAQPGRVLLFVVLSISSGVVLLSFGMACQALAFFFGRAEEVTAQAIHAMIGFALYPPSLFGPATRLVLLTVLPAALMGHVPAALLLDWDWSQAALLVTGVTALAVVSRLAWSAGLARYESGNLTQPVDA